MNDVLKKIEDYALEDIMGERFASYAKEIIQDRAIPDVRDGLKPVQRRILYAMYDAGNTYDKKYIKSAATVGDVLGKYHPHGDSSVYDAMVRMSQWWKQNTPLVDMKGNNGSMDGDSAAAYRYTEARLSKISNELLCDLDKETVEWAPNFDDRMLEPTVLPAKFPNLLVNGTMGISAGYATNIPPHNLGEIIDATIKRIDSPNCHFDSILDIVKGPDFPTGGIVCGKNGIYDALKTGKGRVIIKSKYSFQKEKGKEKIVITEIPYDVNKALLVQKIDAIRIDKKIDGMAEVRDESDREGLRIVIDLKPTANKDLVLNYLLKNTDLQISYNYNMVAIVNRVPKTLGILEILDAYILHQKEVITKRTTFDLRVKERRLHIVDGLIKCISILDEVIKVIRKSKNKSDAEANLVKEFAFSEEQAKAIVVLQLYRLTNTDVVQLEEEKASLQKIIEGLKIILNDESALKYVMKKELKMVSKEYATPRLTEINDEIEEIKIDEISMIQKENTYVVITNEGYIKRLPLKSFNSSDGETTLKPGDYIKNMFETTTLNYLVSFTNFGNYLFIPVHKIFDSKWKELGKHISNLVPLQESERIIDSFILDNDKILTLFTKDGMVKRVLMKDLVVSRYNKTMTAIKLKDNDELSHVCENKKEVTIVTKNGYYLRYLSDEIPTVGPKAAGVKGIKLDDDIVVGASTFDDEDEYINVFTNHNTAKRIKLSDLKTLSRAKKGTQLVKKNKTVTYYVENAFVTNTKDIIIIKKDSEINEIKNSEIPIMDLQSNGSSITKGHVDLYDIKYDVIKTNTKVVPEKEEKKVDKQISFDEFAKDFKL